MNKFMLFLMTTIIFSLVLTSVSAWEFDDVKEYDAETKTVSIVNAFGLGATIAEITLLTPLVNHVGAGEEIHVASYRITTTQPWEEVFGDIELYKGTAQGDPVFKNMKYKYRHSYLEDVDKYETQCTPTFHGNGSIESICEEVFIETVEETLYEWIAFNPVTELPAGSIDIGLFTEVEPFETVEWIPNLFGKEIDEWASWDSSLNVDIFAYYTFNESAPATIFADSVNSYDCNLANLHTTGLIGGSAGSMDDANSCDTGAMFSGNSSFSIWVRRTGNLAPTYVIGTTYVAANENGAFGWNNNGVDSINTNVIDSVSNHVIDTGRTLTLNTWMLFTLTFNTTSAVLYVDGVPVSDYALNDRSQNYTGTFHFNSDIGSGNPSSNYDLDEAGFWNRTLTPSEIFNVLYNGGAGNTYSTQAITIVFNAPEENAVFFAPEFSNISFEVNISVATLKNATLMIDGKFNQSKPISGITNNTVFNQVLKVGEYNWSVIACDIGDVCVSTGSRNLSIIYLQTNQTGYNNPILETATGIFDIKIKYANNSWSSITADFNYAGINYTATQVGAGNIINFTSSVVIPALPGDTAVQNDLYWIFTLTNTTSSIQVTTDTFNQTVDPISFGICNSTQNPYLNLTLHSATEPFPLLNGTLKVSWAIAGANTSYQDLTEHNHTWAFCFDDETQNYTVTSIMEYDGTEYAKNFYYLQDVELSLTTLNIDLYLLNDSLATLTELLVQDQTQSPIETALIQIQLYDVGTDTFYTIGMGKTDFLGGDITYLNWYDSLYRFIITLDGVLIKQTSSGKISATPQTFEISTVTTYPYDTFGNIIYTLIFNNVTNNFVLTFTDPSGDISAGCLRTIKRSFKEDTTICDVCSTSSSATLYCNIGAYGNGTYVSTYYAKLNPMGVIDTVSTFVGAVNRLYDEIGNLDGSIYAFIFAGIVITMFLVHPAFGVIGALLGVAGGMALGFQPINNLEFVGLVILGGVIVWLINK